MKATSPSAPDRDQNPLRQAVWPEGYLKFFDVFNRGDYFAAHEVLEAVWLPARGTSDAPFYKGLIQIAGALVLVGKRRPAPAQRLLQRASELLAAYGPVHLGLAIPPLRMRLGQWQREIDAGRLDARILAERRATAFQLPKPQPPPPG